MVAVEEAPARQLVWEDVRLTVSTPQGPRDVLKGVSGRARSGCLLAIMGSSGAGKTSLLDALAQRISGGKVTGRIGVEGSGWDGKRRPTVAMVPQSDTLLNSATVEETFETASILRLGRISESELRQRVESTIRDLKLEKVRTSFIGGADIRGISGGEKRRVSIGQEICSNEAPVLLLDEPTTGLDSKTAEVVLSNVIELARSKNTVAVCTIHQPSSAITSMFDDLCLLSDGYCVYLGPMKEAVGFFRDAGFPCPEHWNPTDYFMSVLDDKDNTARVLEHYNLKQQQQQQQQMTAVSASELLLSTEDKSSSRKEATSLLVQTRVLCVRNFRQWIRDPAMFESELLQYIFLALFIGGMYFNLKVDLASGVFNRTAAIFILLSVLIFTPPFTAITVFSLERHLFLKERKDRFYSPAAWVLAKSLVTFPVEGVLCLVFSAITYFMMGFQQSAAKFFIFFGILLLFQLVAETTGLLFAIANKSPVYAIVWLSLVLIVALSLAGFLTYEMPIWYRWIQDCNIFRFAILALLINEFDGLQFTTELGETINGISVLPVGLKPSLSLGEYVAILIGALVVLRLTVVAVLHYTDA